MQKLVMLATLVIGTSCSLLPRHEQGSTVALFNGKDLSGWTAFSSKPGVTLEDVWSVRDGLIICQGDPIGWLATEKTYTNYKLCVEWRWAPGHAPGNSGLFQRINGVPQTLPRCIECQLKSGSAGDLLGFQGMTIQGDPARTIKPKKFAWGELTGGVRKIVMAEKTPGEWNSAEITVLGDQITVIINGQKINEATRVPQVAGHVGLQSEGGEVHFRNVQLTPLD